MRQLEISALGLLTVQSELRGMAGRLPHLDANLLEHIVQHLEPRDFHYLANSCKSLRRLLWVAPHGPGTSVPGPNEQSPFVQKRRGFDQAMATGTGRRLVEGTKVIAAN